MARQRSLLSAFMLFVVLAPAHAESFREASCHFDFTVPGGWARWPAPTLNAANQFARQRAPGRKIEFIAGFQPPGSLLGSYPYMLVQVQKHSNGNSSYEEIERSLTEATRTAAREVKGALADLTSNISVGEGVLDRKNNRVILRYELDAPNVGKIEGITLSYIGKEAIVSLHYYDRARNFAESVKTFLLFGNTFEFEKEYTFKAVPSSRLVAGMDQMTLSVGVLTAAGMAVVGIVLMPRKQNKPTDMNWTSGTYREPS